METKQTYAQMLGMAEAAPATPAGPPSPDLNAVMDPNVSAPLAQMQRPVQSPSELEARKQGWAAVAEKLSDPNLLRALGFAGAAMAQPGSSVGQGLLTGMTAYNAGEYGKYQQDMEKQEAARRQAESTARVGSLEAQTATEQARLPGVQAESQYQKETLKSRVETSQLAAQNAKFTLEKAKSEEEVARVEREVRRRTAEIRRTIPEGRERQAMLAEMDKAIAEVDAKRAEIQRTRAQTGLIGAQRQVTGAQAIKEGALASQETIEAQELAALSPADRLAYLSKTGRFAATSGGGTRTAQDEVVWGKLYDGMSQTAKDDPRVKGKTREQFITDMLTKQSPKDWTDMIKAYAAGGGDDPEVLTRLSDGLKASLGQAPGGGEEMVKNPSTGRYELKRTGGGTGGKSGGPSTPTAPAAGRPAQSAAPTAPPEAMGSSTQTVGPLSPNWLLEQEAAKGNVKAKRLLQERKAAAAAGTGEFSRGDEPVQ